MLTLFGTHPRETKALSSADVTWLYDLARRCPIEPLTNGPRKELFERDAKKRARWARAALHTLFPEGKGHADPHSMEQKPVLVAERTPLVDLFMRCPLPFIESLYDPGSEVPDNAADTWVRMEWARAMLFQLFPVFGRESV